MWPYKISLVQGLQEGDTEKRLEFSEWFHKNEHSLLDILWSDECYFSLSGTLNTHNCRILSDHNPHCIKETQLHSPQICIWMGISAKFALQPFFFEGAVNSENYLKMLKTHVIPQLKKRRSFSRTIFMQDDTRLHIIRLKLESF